MMIIRSTSFNSEDSFEVKNVNDHMRQKRYKEIFSEV